MLLCGQTCLDCRYSTSTLQWADPGYELQSAIITAGMKQQPWADGHAHPYPKFRGKLYLKVGEHCVHAPEDNFHGGVQIFQRDASWQQYELCRWMHHSTTLGDLHFGLLQGWGAVVSLPRTHRPRRFPSRQKVHGFHPT